MSDLAQDIANARTLLSHAPDEGIGGAKAGDLHELPGRVEKAIAPATASASEIARAKLAAVERVLRIGGMFSNTIYNLSQRPELQEELASPAGLVSEWDDEATKLLADLRALSAPVVAPVEESGAGGLVWMPIKEAEIDGNKVIGRSKRGDVFDCEFWSSERIARDPGMTGDPNDYDAAWFRDGYDEMFPVEYLANAPSPLLPDGGRARALEEAGDTTWFWQIVDATGLADVPSDEAEALRLILTRLVRAEAALSAQSRVQGGRATGDGWRPIAELGPKTKAVLGRWMDNGDGTRHWAQHEGFYADVNGFNEWCGFRFGGSPFYGNSPTHFLAIPDAPAPQDAPAEGEEKEGAPFGPGCSASPSPSVSALTGEHPSRVHVVMGTTGEYSDRTEWPVVAYPSAEQAQEHVRLATEWMQKNCDPHKLYALGYLERAEWRKANTNPYDPSMEVDYTGTTWFTYEVPVAASGIEAATADETRSGPTEGESPARQGDAQGGSPHA